MLVEKVVSGTPQARWASQALMSSRANFLNVSRSFVIKEMEAGRLPHRKVGSHRRIALEDLLAYEQKMAVNFHWKLVQVKLVASLRF